MSCDEVRKRLNKPKPPAPPPPPPARKLFNSQLLLGPGSALKWIFVTRYHVSACGGCHKTAKEMDKIGPDAVLKRIDYFAEQIHQNALSRKWMKVLAFVDHAVFGLEHYKSLIREAVNLHIAEVARKRG